jgi:methylenetetrahydrofolate dehydrogenase (NADP+)/methenyltetrahydrofolate cyclohydrolase
VQLPLPVNPRAEALDAVHPLKDVDCFHPENVGLLVQGRPRYLPNTPHGCLQLLHRHRISVSGQHAVVVGRSEIVGKPLATLLAAKTSHLGPLACNATVTLCHSKTKDLAALCRQADILVAAIGRPKFITGDMVKPSAVVIDVGINRTDAGVSATSISPPPSRSPPPSPRPPRRRPAHRHDADAQHARRARAQVA